ncbi:sulfotransferase, partial [Burkholderia pseudomallei]
RTPGPFRRAPRRARFVARHTAGLQKEHGMTHAATGAALGTPIGAVRPRPVLMIPLRRCGCHALRLRLNLNSQCYSPY